MTGALGYPAVERITVPGMEDETNWEAESIYCVRILVITLLGLELCNRE